MCSHSVAGQVYKYSSGKLATEIYSKDTCSDQCLSFHSFTPQHYKTGVIRTLLNRAYKISINWPSIDKEVILLKQIFTNNNYLMSMVDKEMNRSPASKLETANGSIEQAFSPTMLF